jgi:lipopolysaccharide assembly LptE-like protein
MRPGSRGIPLLLLPIVCQFLFLGCGYRPVGEGSLPHGIRRLYLAALSNGTFKPGVQGVVGAAILRRLQFDARVRLTSEPEAEATLGGTVTTYQNDPIAFEQTDIGLRFRVRLTLLFTLTERQGGESLLQEEVAGEAYYTAGTTGVTATRAAEDETMQRAAQDLATKVVARLMEDL